MDDLQVKAENVEQINEEIRSGTPVKDIIDAMMKSEGNPDVVIDLSNSAQTLAELQEVFSVIKADFEEFAEKVRARDELRDNCKKLEAVISDVGPTGFGRDF